MDFLWTDDAGTAQALAFDAVISEQHELPAEVTEHPVEGGSNTSDHVIVGNIRLTLEATVSNTPIKVPTTHLSGVTGAYGSADLGNFTKPQLRKGAQGSQSAEYDTVSNPGAATVLKFSGEVNRVSLILAELDRLRTNGTLLTVISDLRDYENMVIENVSAPVGVSGTNSITFTIETKQVSISDSELVATPEPTQERGRASRNRGNQATSEASEQDTTNRTSLARNILDRIRGEN